MAFLNPFMLLGIAAVSVPIVIHLLNKRKFERVVWAAMRFLRISVEQNQRRIKIEDILLLILRCVLLALLALALARPALRGANAGIFGQAKVTAVVVIDNSYSMSQSDGVMSRMDRAKKAAEQVLDTLPAGSSTAVLLASDVVKGAIPEPTFDLNLARKVIHEAPLTSRSTDLFPAIRDAIGILNRKAGLRKEVYLITDGQLLGWRQFDQIKNTLEQAKENIRVHLVFAGAKEQQNLGVSDLRLASGLSPVERPLRFEAQVTNYGLAEARDVRLTLRVDGDPPSDETTIESIPAGASRGVSVFAKLRTADFHTVTAAIPPDRLPADDERTIALRGWKEINVLLVDGDPGRESRDGQTFFLKHALVPVPPAEAEGYFIRTQSIAPAELETTQLSRFEEGAIVLADVQDLSEKAAEAIAAYLKHGGGIIIFPGPHTDTAAWNAQLYQKQRILPAALGQAHGQADQQEQFFTLSDKNLEHPIAAIWKDKGAGSPTAARFYRAFELIEEAAKGAQPKASGNDGAGEARVVLRYSDGKPAVMERPWGTGRVILFSSTANTAWNDLAVRPGVYIPLMYRTLGAIVERQDEGLNVRVGQKFVYRAAAEQLGKDAVVTRPGKEQGREGEQGGKDARKIEMQGSAPVLQFDETDLAGGYAAAIAAEPAMTVKFAAQADPAESSLEEISAEQLNQLREVADVIEWSPGMQIETAIETERVGAELWLPIAVAALVLASAETLLAHWFSRSK